MDNSNNPNWSNNPLPPAATPPAPDPLQTPFPTPSTNGSADHAGWNPPAAASVFTPPDPTLANPSLADQTIPQPSVPPSVPPPPPPSTPSPSLFSPPVSDPLNNPWNQTPAPIAQPQPVPAGTYSAPIPDAVPAAVLPDTMSTPPLPAASAVSPLDNPWDVPVQPPPINNTFPSPATSDTQTATPQPTWVPPSGNPDTISSIQPDIQPEPTSASPTPPPMQPESAPTDLSHLLGNNPQPDTNHPAASTPAETLVVPPITPDATASVAGNNHQGIPKWLIGVGVGLLIVVSGASAYFILGIGQPSKISNSIPATQEAKPVIRTAPPIPTPASRPAASSSASFGQLGNVPAAPNGSGAPGTPPPQASSAAEILLQRR